MGDFVGHRVNYKTMMIFRHELYIKKIINLYNFRPLTDLKKIKVFDPLMICFLLCLFGNGLMIVFDKVLVFFFSLLDFKCHIDVIYIHVH